MDEYGLSLYSLEQATNEDIAVTYTPDFSVINYSYTILKDGVKKESIEVNKNIETNFIFIETGTYEIEIITNSIYGKNTIRSGKYIIDKEKPIINIKNSSYELKLGDSLNIMEDVSATDNQDGDITSFITTNKKELNFNEEGNKKLVYTVKDSAGNTASKTVDINVVSNQDTYLHIIQFSIVLIIIILFYIILRFMNSMRKERRLMNYSIKPIKDNSKSLMETINKSYNSLINSLSNLLVKSEFIKKYSKHYLKYTEVFEKENTNPVKFISRKIVVGIIFVLVAVLTSTIRFDVLSAYELVIPFIVGFFALDLIYEYRYRLYRKKIENDLLQAIIIMNNAFKSGRSITQAVNLVSEELEGPIALEFKKISMELSFGLDIEVAFKRFSERINIEEANYLTSSLSILNKTGGNIIKVFTSIEKTLFNRKKLRLELKSLTGSSKLIMYVLILVPICFVSLVSFINKDYFKPLFTSPIGIIIIISIIILYLIYIFVVRKVMKIRM